MTDHQQPATDAPWIRRGIGTMNGRRQRYVSCLDCGWLTYTDSPTVVDHATDCPHNQPQPATDAPSARLSGDTDDYSAWVQRLEPIAAERVGWMDDRITELTERLRQVEDERDEARAALDRLVTVVIQDWPAGGYWCVACQCWLEDRGPHGWCGFGQVLAAASSPAPMEPAPDEGAGSGS
jgi:hypothetical protein